MVENIRSEALKFVSSAQRSFVAGISQAELLLPDKTDKMARVTALDIFVEAGVGFLVSTVCTFVNDNEKTEGLLIDGIKRKFEIARKMGKKGPDSIIQP